jgi:hypothetical protein
MMLHVYLPMKKDMISVFSVLVLIKYINMGQGQKRPGYICIQNIIHEAVMLRNNFTIDLYVGNLSQ